MPHNPSLTPLTEWPDGWLKLSCAAHLGIEFLVAFKDEKLKLGWPVTRTEMISFLIAKGDIPEAGVSRTILIGSYLKH